MNLIRTFISESVRDTEQIAETLSGMLKPGDLVLLSGEIGSGKTFLVSRICKHLNVGDIVTSPTFTIINQYSGPFRINHMDFYRINKKSELDHLGWEDLISEDSITFIEWPDWIEQMVDDYYKILILIHEEKRVFKLYSSN